MAVKDKAGIPLKDGNGLSFVKAVRFKQGPIPYYLEGMVRLLRTENNPLEGSILKEPYSSAMRKGEIRRIDIFITSGKHL